MGRMMVRVIKPVSIVLVGILWSCGGGGGGDGSNVKTGYFGGIPVEGLRYQTATQSGITDSAGTFLYQEGEIVSFYIGDVLVGRAKGKEQLSPFDLAGLLPPKSAIEIKRIINHVYRSEERATPIEVATNVSVFLQTIDEDGELSNSVRIPSEMHVIAAGSKLVFNQRWHEFYKSFHLRKLIAAGRNRGLWGGSRSIRHPAVALDALYEGLGLTPELYVRTVWQVVDAAGVVRSRRTYNYDIDGKLIKRVISEEDLDADGVAEYRSVTTYDSNGNQIVMESDRAADGTVDSRITKTYDANGNLLVIEYDTDGDGRADSRSTFTYDANDSLIMRVGDKNADGVADTIQTIFYDDEGNRIRDEYDINADGVADGLVTVAYTGNGVVVISEDGNADGVVDTRYVNTYDPDGILIRREIDYGVDGVMDLRDIYTYDADGKMTMFEKDADGDGVVDFRIRYRYDIYGNQIEMERDSNVDGVVDSRTVSTYDANGNRTIYERDDNADGIVNFRETSYFDAKGNLIRSEIDNDADGVVDRVEMLDYQLVSGWSPYFWD